MVDVEAAGGAIGGRVGVAILNGKRQKLSQEFSEMLLILACVA